MKFFKKHISFLTVVVMAVMAFLLVQQIAVNQYGASQFAATMVAGAACAVLIVVPCIPGVMPQGALFFALTPANIVRNATSNNIAGTMLDHYYAFEEDILSYPAALTPDFLAATTFGQLVTIPDDDPFIMKTGKCFHTLPCTPDEGKIKSTLVGPTESMAFENSADFGNAGNNDPLRGYIAYTANKKQILIMRELNGTLKVVGTQGYPAIYKSAEASNGGKVSDGNTLKHSLVSYSVVPCPTYLAAVPLTPAA
jgi:hypothetical protein